MNATKKRFLCTAWPRPDSQAPTLAPLIIRAADDASDAIGQARRLWGLASEFVRGPSAMAINFKAHRVADGTVWACSATKMQSSARGPQFDSAPVVADTEAEAIAKARILLGLGSPDAYKIDVVKIEEI